MPILSAIGAGFGSDKVTPRYLAPSLNKPLINLGKQALSSLSTGAASAERNFNLGTERQARLMNQQEDVGQQLLSRALNQDPNQLLGDVGRTAFSFIDPNVVAPAARFDVNYDRIGRMARGLNPAAVDSTAQRLRDARIASNRYLDVARNVYSQLPSLYNQVYNAGVGNADMAFSYLPQLMAGYRQLDTAPLDAARLVSSAANTGSGNVSNLNNALRSGVYGYQQDRNIWDRLGAVDTSMWNSLKDAVQMASSVYGGFLGGGAGGALGGMMGGGGGGGGMGNGPQGAQLKPQFMPAPTYIPQQIGPGGTYNPGPPVQSFDLPPQQYQPGNPQIPPGWFPG